MGYNERTEFIFVKKIAVHSNYFSGFLKFQRERQRADVPTGHQHVHRGRLP
jgi:hypothetical protein